MNHENRDFVTGAAKSHVSRRKFIGGATAGISVLTLGGFLTACSSESGETSTAGGTGKPRKGGTLRTAIGDVSTKDSTDPAVGFSSTAGWLASMLYSTLVRTGLDFKLQPNLAKSWEINKDGAEWVFHLRSDVKFHDGTPLTAKDVAWTITRLLDKGVGSPLRARLVGSLDPGGVTVVDDTTLKLSLKAPNVFLGEALAGYAAGVVKDKQSSFSTSSAIGTGPFKLKSFTPGESFEVVRNEDYFEAGLPYLDGIQNTHVDASTVLQALGAGTIDWTDSLDPKSVGQLKGDSRFTSPALTGDQRAVRTYFLHMKLDKKPFDDPRVVMAFKLAADRDAIRKAVLGELGTITGDVPVPLDDATYPRSIGKRPQNIAKAKQLLAEAGYANGVDVELPTAEFQPGMTAFSQAYAEVVKPAGIRVKVRQVPVDTYFDRVFGQVPMFHDYAQRVSAYAILNNFFQKGGSYNGTGFDNDGKLTAYLDRVLSEPVESKRNAILTEALAYTANHSGSIIDFFVPIVQTSRAQVQGDLYSPMYAWERMWLKA